MKSCVFATFVQDPIRRMMAALDFLFAVSDFVSGHARGARAVQS